MLSEKTRRLFSRPDTLKPTRFYLDVMLKLDLITTFATRMIIIATGFTISIFTAHYLGPAGRGNYFFVITFATIVAQFCNFGLQSSNTYLVALHEQLLAKLISNSLWISLIIGIGGTGLILFVYYLAHQLMENALWLTFIFVPSTLFYLLGTNLLIGINKVQLFNLFQAGTALLSFLAILIAGIFKLQYEGFIAASTISSLISALILLVVLSHKTLLSFRFDAKTFYLGLQYSIKNYIASLLAFLILKGNVFFLKQYSNNETLGYFSIASQINDVLIILPTTVGLLLFPNLVRNSNNRWQQTKHNLLNICIIMLITCMVTAIVIKPIIYIVFGQRFEPSVPILLCMLPGTFFLGATSIISQYLASLGYPRQLIYIWLGGFFLLCALSYCFVPHFSAVGAAVSQSITYGVLFSIILSFSCKVNRLANSSGVNQNLPSKLIEVR